MNLYNIHSYAPGFKAAMSAQFGSIITISITFRMQYEVGLRRYLITEKTNLEY